MSSKEILLAEIAGLSDDSADAVLQFVRQFVKSQPTDRNGSLLAKLKDVRINAPADFSSNLDLYLSGEKRVDDDVH